MRFNNKKNEEGSTLHREANREKKTKTKQDPPLKSE